MRGRYLAAFGSVVGLVLLFSMPTRAEPKPSFDCAKAAETTEKVICGDDQLATLDQELSHLYAARLAELEGTAQAALKYDEKRWVDLRMRLCRARSDVQAIKSCLVDSYKTRIGEMRGDCDIDEELTVEDIAQLKQPWSPKIPKGFTVKRDFQIYRNNDHKEALALPNDALPAAHRGAFGMRCCGGSWQVVCKATGPDGSEWLVLPGRDALHYVSPKDMEPASSYDARVEREYRERQERRKQAAPKQ